MLVAPRYGSGSLADVFPSVLACLGVPGEQDVLGLDLTARRVCVLLVDGLGAEALAAHPDSAPVLTRMAPATLTAGFPSTTATSISSLGTGLPPGRHGILGYLIRVPGQPHLINTLRWQWDGIGTDATGDLVPERFQPSPTVFERATAAGIAVSHVGPAYQGGSGLTRAVLRGCAFRPAFSVGDLIDGVVTALEATDRSLVYAYHADLDSTGHLRGPSSRAWRLELENVDRIVAALAERLPAGTALLVTADHGMIEPTARIDLDAEPDLRDGIDAFGGEPRARHLYTAPGAVDDVASAWRAVLGEDFAVRTRAEAVAEGWFGPVVDPAVSGRVGDLVVAATGSRILVRAEAEPMQSAMIGHHGSLTAAELHIPLAVHTA